MLTNIKGIRKVCDKVSFSLYFKSYIILTAILFETEDAFSRWQFLWKSKRVTRIYQDFFLRFQVLFQMIVASCKGNHYKTIKSISEPGYLTERVIYSVLLKADAWTNPFTDEKSPFILKLLFFFSSFLGK